MAATKNRVEGGILASVHKTAAGLHKAGLVDKATMREFDALCLTPVEPLTTQEIRDDRTRPRSSNFVVNPGLRFAINCRSGLQIVPGVSVPIQFGGGTRGSVLFYLSLEHAVRRPR